MMSSADDVRATADALARIAASGSNLSRPMVIDFFIAVPGERAGQGGARLASAAGFETRVERDHPTGKWTCYRSKALIPELAAVVRIEQLLDELARPFGGQADGFGSFGNCNVPLN